MQSPEMIGSYRPPLATPMPVMGTYGPSMGPPGPDIGSVWHHMVPPWQHVGPPEQHMGPPGQHIGPSGQYMRPPEQHMAPSGQYMGPSGQYMRPPEQHMRPPEQHMRPPGQHMGPPGQHMGPPGQHMGPSGQHMGPSGQHMGPPGQPMGPPGQHMGPSGQHMGSHGQPMGPPGQHMGPSGQHMGSPGQHMGSPGQHMGPSGQPMGPPGQHMGSSGQHMGSPGQPMGPPGQHMGPLGQHMGPHGQYMGPAGSSMRPTGPNTGSLGMSESQMGSLEMPPIPQQEQPCIPNYSSPLSNLHPVQPVNQPADNLWVESTTPSCQGKFRRKKSGNIRFSSWERRGRINTHMSSWERSQNACMVTETQVDIAYNMITQDSTETGISEFDAHGCVEIDKTSQNYWNTVRKMSQTAELQPKQTEVTECTEHPNPAVVSDYQVQSASVRSQVLVPLKEINTDTEVSQAQTSVQQNAAKDVKTDSEVSSDESEEEVVEEKKNQTEVIEEKKPESKAEQKPVTKTKPVSSTPIPDTVWRVVRTNDGKHFFYNPTKRQSVWKMPEELKNRPDVEMLLPPKPEVKTEIKEEKDLQEEPPSKKIKLEAEVKEEKEESNNEVTQEIVLEKETINAVKVEAAENMPVVSFQERKQKFKELIAEKHDSKPSALLPPQECKLTFVKLEAEVKEVTEESNNEVSQNTVLEKETTNTVKVQAAENMPIVSLEERKRQFKELLAENDVSTPSTRWKEFYKIVFDKSSTILTLQERKQAFGEYLKESAEEEHKKRHRLESEVKGEKKESSWEVTQEIVLEKETPNAVEVQTAENIPVVSFQDRRKQLDVSPPSEPRPPQKRKLTFAEMVKNRLEEERLEKRYMHIEGNAVLFRKLLEESNLNVNSTFQSFEDSYSHDERFGMVRYFRDKKYIFQDYINELIQQEKETFALSREKDSTPSELFPPQEHKLTFAEIVKKRIEEERMNRYRQIEGNPELFRQLLEESNLNVNSTFQSFEDSYSHDERFGMVRYFRDKKYIFQDYINELAQQEKETFALVREKVKNDFMKMLSETPGIDQRTSWRDLKQILYLDPRYKAVTHAAHRRVWFFEYLKAELDVKGDFMIMLSEIPDLDHNTSWDDVKNKVSSDPRCKAVSDTRQEEWFKVYLETVTNVISDDISKEEVQEKQLYSSSLKSENESWQDRRDAAFKDFKQFLVENVKETKLLFNAFKTRFFKSPRWTMELSHKEKKKLYGNHIYAIRKKDREILRSILDEMDLSLDVEWSEVKKQIQANPKFVNYTDSEDLDDDYALLMHEQDLKLEEDCENYSSQSSSPERQEIYSSW